MIVRGLTEQQISKVSRKLKMKLVHVRPQGRGIAFVIRPEYASKCRYYRRGFTGHKIAAVCWHGHRDFMRGLFSLNPEAVVKTCKVSYKGADEFESKYRDTGYQNIGSVVSPLQYADACDCGEGVR